jgi:hypothetical protein
VTSLTGSSQGEVEGNKKEVERSLLGVVKCLIETLFSAMQKTPRPNLINSLKEVFDFQCLLILHPPLFETCEIYNL